MSEEIDNIGELFRNTLKDHRLDSDANLWDRLETQLSAQTTVSVPKTSAIRHLAWAKVAVAASVIVSVALAFNYIYLPLKNATSITETNKPINNNKPTETIIDSSSSQNILKNKEINLIERKENSSIKQEQTINKTNNKSFKSDEKEPIINNNVLPNFNNNQSINQQNNPILNTPKNSINNSVVQSNSVINVVTKKDSLIQPLIDDNFDRNQVKQNTSAYQDSQKSDELINNIPNIFTPNNDGVNDYFVIKDIEKCSNNQLVIKDRNGKTVFEKINYQNDWDARNVADGVYFYFLKCKTSNDNLGKMGSITIKR